MKNQPELFPNRSMNLSEVDSRERLVIQRLVGRQERERRPFEGLTELAILRLKRNVLFANKLERDYGGDFPIISNAMRLIDILEEKPFKLSPETNNILLETIRQAKQRCLLIRNLHSKKTLPQQTIVKISPFEMGLIRSCSEIMSSGTNYDHRLIEILEMGYLDYTKSNESPPVKGIKKDERALERFVSSTTKGVAFLGCDFVLLYPILLKQLGELKRTFPGVEIEGAVENRFSPEISYFNEGKPFQVFRQYECRKERRSFIVREGRFYTDKVPNDIITVVSN